MDKKFAHVLFVGSHKNFGEEVKKWLKKRRIGYCFVEGHSEGIWMLKIASAEVPELHKLLNDPKEHKDLQGMFCVLFPQGLFLERGKERSMLLGRAYEQQQDLIRNLRPINSTPDMRTDLL